jgi:hypothetical protein
MLASGKAFDVLGWHANHINAGLQLLLEAGAQRTLEAIGSMPWLGGRLLTVFFSCKPRLPR